MSRCSPALPAGAMVWPGLVDSPAHLHIDLLPAVRGAATAEGPRRRSAAVARAGAAGSTSPGPAATTKPWSFTATWGSSRPRSPAKTRARTSAAVCLRRGRDGTWSRCSRRRPRTGPATCRTRCRMRRPRATVADIGAVAGGRHVPRWSLTPSSRAAWRSERPRAEPRRTCVSATGSPGPGRVAPPGRQDGPVRLRDRKHLGPDLGRPLQVRLGRAAALRRSASSPPYTRVLGQATAAARITRVGRDSRAAATPR